MKISDKAIESIVRDVLDCSQRLAKRKNRQARHPCPDCQASGDETGPMPEASAATEKATVLEFPFKLP